MAKPRRFSVALGDWLTLFCPFLVRFPDVEMTDGNLSVQMVNWEVFNKFNFANFSV